MAKFGFQCKLYINADGVGQATTGWTEVKTTKDATLNMTAVESDGTTRANNGFKATAAAMKEASVDVEMPWNPAADGFTDLRDAFLNSTPIGVAAMDGDITAAGSQGLVADMAVTEFTRNEPVGGDLATVKITLKPTISDTAPDWLEVAGS